MAGLASLGRLPGRLLTHLMTWPGFGRLVKTTTDSVENLIQAGPERWRRASLLRMDTRNAEAAAGRIENEYLRAGKMPAEAHAEGQKIRVASTKYSNPDILEEDVRAGGTFIGRAKALWGGKFSAVVAAIGGYLGVSAIVDWKTRAGMNSTVSALAPVMDEAEKGLINRIAEPLLKANPKFGPDVASKFTRDQVPDCRDGWFNKLTLPADCRDKVTNNVNVQDYRTLELTNPASPDNKLTIRVGVNANNVSTSSGIPDVLHGQYTFSLATVKGQTPDPDLQKLMLGLVEKATGKPISDDFKKNLKAACTANPGGNGAMRCETSNQILRDVYKISVDVKKPTKPTIAAR